LWVRKEKFIPRFSEKKKGVKKTDWSEEIVAPSRGNGKHSLLNRGGGRSQQKNGERERGIKTKNGEKVCVDRGAARVTRSRKKQQRDDPDGSNVGYKVEMATNLLLSLASW